MRRILCALAVLGLVSGFNLYSYAQGLATTTTLAAETGNNTSAADSFTTQSDNNLGASNISKMPLAKLLYAGSNTQIYVHFMPWFGGANHMSVGYASNDANQVHRQQTDMVSRGVQGAIIDWYGPSSAHARENQTAQLMMADAETRGGAFQFAIMEDAGALQSCAQTAGCDITGQLVSDLNYVNATFYPSPAYMRTNGRPVVFFFGEEAYTIDWNRVRAGVLGNPLFIFRNSVGYGYADSDGGFSWIGLGDPTSFGPSYLDSFYVTAQQDAAQQTYGSAYKGFNDTLAAWGGGRIMNQNCGQTWMASLAEAGKYWSAARQLANLQMVTWNDYEEGSELESGIDNCVTVGATLSSQALNWTITGDESTIDHYTVFATLDGENLASLGDVAAGTHTFNLTAANLPQASYSLYVKAVAKAWMTNKMSSSVAYGGAANASAPGTGSGTGSAGSGTSTGASTGTAGAGTGTGTSSSSGAGGAASGPGTTSTGTTSAPVASPDMKIAVTPGTISVASGQSGSASLDVTPMGGFNGSVTFACVNLPADAVCSFAPATLSASGATTGTTLSIATAALNGKAMGGQFSNSLNARGGNDGQRNMKWLAMGTPGFGLAGMVVVSVRRRRLLKIAALGAMLTMVLALSACGGTGMTAANAGSTPGQPQLAGTPKGNYTVTVTAASGALTRSTTLTLAVQ